MFQYFEIQPVSALGPFLQQKFANSRTYGELNLHNKSLRLLLIVYTRGGSNQRNRLE